MQRIEAEWLSYRTMVVPPDAEEVQLSETRKAFFAGAVAVIAILSDHLLINKTPTKDELLILAQLTKELEVFKFNMSRGLI